MGKAILNSKASEFIPKEILDGSENIEDTLEIKEMLSEIQDNLDDDISQKQVEVWRRMSNSMINIL